MIYTAAMVARARRLHDEEWTPTAISYRLGKEFGQRPHRDTVKTWVDPDAADRLRMANAASKRRARARRLAAVPPEPAFMDRVLLTLRREDRLTYPTIAKVVRRFYAVDMDAEAIRFRLYELGVEKNPNKTRANQDRTVA